MKLRNFLTEYYNPSQDSLGAKSRKDLRRPRITLRSLNRMRKRKELKRFEEGKRKKFLPTMYKTPSVE